MTVRKFNLLGELVTEAIGDTTADMVDALDGAPFTAPDVRSLDRRVNASVRSLLERTGVAHHPDAMQSPGVDVVTGLGGEMHVFPNRALLALCTVEG